MPTEKILIFDEAGNAKRMKVRIARFLDNEPVTASDKENIRTTLDVDDSLSGTFTTPLSVTSASDSSFTGGGNVGIGTSSPDRALHCYSDSVATVLKLDSAGADTGLEFAHSDTVAAGINCSTGGDLEFRTGANSGASERWRIDGSNGNLIASSGVGIDFGATNTTTGVTVTGSVMSEYEQGTFTPKLADAASGGNEASFYNVGADYIRVGNQVFFAMWLIDINTTGLTSGNTIYITDMPYVCKSGSSYVPFVVMADTLTFGGQLVGALQGGVGYAILRQFSSGGTDTALTVSAISSGTTDLFMSGSYFVA